MIAINAKPAFGEPRTGLEEYSFQLISHLIYEAEKRGLKKYFSLYAPSWHNIPQAFLSTDIQILKPRRLWTQGRLAIQLLWDNPDIFFSPEQVLPRFAPKASVITVHDLAYEIYPEAYSAWQRGYLRSVTKSAAHRAKKVIAISERTKRDLGKYYAVSQRKIEVVYHGFALPKGVEFPQVKSEIRPSSLPTSKPYFFFLGRIERKKNIVSLIEAFEKYSLASGREYALILAGAPGFGYEEIFHRVEDSALKNDIFLLGYVNQEVKYALYQNACAFVFVPLYEGFGLPILEAQSFGIPVVCSNSSSLPEVAGESALLVDPMDISRIAEKMAEAVHQKKIRSYLIKKGYENLNRFSWGKTARETLDILLSL